MRWALWSLLSPSQLLVLLAILGPLLALFGAVRWGRRLGLCAAVGLLVFGVLPSSHYLVDALESRFPQPVLPARIDGIVLLAGAERPAATERHGEPQLNRHATRYLTALRLATRHPRARLAWVGGPDRDLDDGAAAQGLVARALLGSMGLDPARVTFERRATDTCDSAVNAHRLLAPRAGENWVLVTSAVHMPRAMACFRAAGWQVIPQPADRQVVIGGWDSNSVRIADNLALLDVALHEWLGLLFYRLSGRTTELLPAPAPPLTPNPVVTRSLHRAPAHPDWSRST